MVSYANIHRSPRILMFLAASVEIFGSGRYPNDSHKASTTEYFPHLICPASLLRRFSVCRTQPHNTLHSQHVNVTSPNIIAGLTSLYMVYNSPDILATSIMSSNSLRLAVSLD